MLKFLVLVATTVMLSACSTVPPPSLGPTDFQKYRIVDVAVEGVEVISSWPAEEEAFVRSNSVDADTVGRLQTEPASSFPAVRAHLHRALTARFKEEFASQGAGVFSGSRPLRAVVRLKAFDVPSTARRVFTDDTAKIQADIDLVDPASKAVILRYEGPFRGRRLIGGLATGLALALDRSDVGQSQITDYMKAYRNWLLQN
jgi:hypothetical protein